MEKERLGEWIIERKQWMKERSHYLLNSYSLDFCNIDELVSLTVEFLYEKVDILREETLDSYTMTCMKNLMFNKILYYKKKTVCVENMVDYDDCEEEYSIETDENTENMIKIVENRVENDVDVIVLLTLLTEGKISKLGIKNDKVAESMKRIKGIEIKHKTPLKSKLRIGRTYKGVARIKDGKIDKVYESTISVKADGFHQSTVSASCNGNWRKITNHEYKGYFWYFINEIPKGVLKSYNESKETNS